MIPVFEANPHVAARLQDAVAAHMLASIPRRRQLTAKSVRVAPPAEQGAAAQIAKRAAERKAIAPTVLRMRQEGMLQRDIARELKMSVDRLRVIIAEAGQ